MKRPSPIAVRRAAPGRGRSEAGTAARGADAGDGHQRSRDSARSRSRFLQEPAGHLHRREHGHRDEFEGQHLHLPPRERDAAVRVLAGRAPSCARSAAHNYGFAFAHSVRVDAQDNIWAVDEGTDMLIKFNPAGQMLMTIGRREDPVAMLSNMPGAGAFHGRNAKYRFGRADRRRVRSAGQHLRLRRLLRCARREVRQGRPLRQGRRHARRRQPAVQHAAFDRHGLPGQRLRRRPRQRAGSGARQRPRAGRRTTRTSAIRGPCACRADPGRRIPASSTCTCRTRGPTARPRRPRSSRARSTRWSSTARSSASSAAPEKRRASSPRFIRWTAAIRT